MITEDLASWGREVMIAANDDVDQSLIRQIPAPGGVTKGHGDQGLLAKYWEWKGH